MTGSVFPLDGGRYESVRYSKTLYGNPAPVGVGPQSIIALVSSDGGFGETAPVGMGGQTVMMTIDTGAMFGA